MRRDADPAVSPDANVESVRQKFLERSRIGLAKYGVTTERKDLSFRDWLIHLQQELMDGVVYIEAALNQPTQPPAQQPEPSTACPGPGQPAGGSTSILPG